MPRKGERKVKQVVGDPSDPRGMAVMLSRFLEWMRVQNYSERTVGNRQLYLGYFIEWCAARGISQPAEVTKPILVTAGYNDPRVPPSDPRRFAYVLSQLGKPVWYYEETEAGHGSTFKKQLIFDYTSYYVFTMMHVM